MPSSDPEALRVLRERGFIQQISDEAELRAQLTSGRVTFYSGFDPTASSLHVGSLVPLMAMAHLARAGHRPIAVLGGGTTMVGDPSGKTELRQMLTKEAIAENRVGIERQVRNILKDAPDAIVVDNAEWLLPLNYIDFLRDIGRHFSVNRMIAAEAYKQRLEKGLSFIEFNYQLLQAYDFLVLRRKHGCTLQIGGDDQWGNIVAGVDLIRRVDQAQAYALTFPLITTATGAKMGKTAAGAVWLDAQRTSPYDFYQYFVNVDDRDVVRFLKLFTLRPLDEIARFETIEGAELRDAKAMLAHGVTAIVHGAAAADDARRAAAAAFGGGGDEAAIPTFGVAGGEKIVDVLAASGLAASKSVARRLIEQGGVRLGERKIATVDETLAATDIGDGVLLHAGKKSVRRLVLAR
ncbi:MAG TPA: tyrosine--tRNA ligase [Polyangia bacterium]|jgi:tyrosyl-tRNA synthetase|nr:tyrosine--tRNA ligase [Polyangia bacterium]